MPKKDAENLEIGKKSLYEHMRMVAKSCTTKRMLETQ